MEYFVSNNNRRLDEENYETMIVSIYNLLISLILIAGMNVQFSNVWDMVKMWVFNSRLYTIFEVLYRVYVYFQRVFMREYIYE